MKSKHLGGTEVLVGEQRVCLNYCQTEDCMGGGGGEGGERERGSGVIHLYIICGVLIAQLECRAGGHGIPRSWSGNYTNENNRNATSQYGQDDARVNQPYPIHKGLGHSTIEAINECAHSFAKLCTH